MSREKHPQSYHVIRYQDCDPLSHLNNGRYLDYFMNAREDQLLKFYDFNVYERIQTHGQGWVVAKSEILYRSAALLMEKVLIKTQVNNFSKKHIEVEMAMYNEDGTKLKALLRSVFILFDLKTNKSIEHDDELMELLSDVRVEGVNPNIDERVIELQGALASA